MTPRPAVAHSRAAHPVPAMLGMGWFPDELGGLTRYFTDLRAALADGGAHPPAVVVGPVAHPPPGVAIAAGAELPLPLRLISYARAARRASRAADLVDAHFALYAALPVLAGTLGGRPLVVHFQGPWAREALSAGQGTMSVAAKRRLERWVYRRARRIVVLSPAFRRVLVEDYGIPPWRIDVVPPGIDLEHFRPGDGTERARLGVPSDRWTVVVARRLVPRMGVDVLLRAWARLGEDSLAGLLAVVGDGPMRAELEALARQLGIAASVRFLGRVADAELRDWYRAADLCAIPSLELEGFGLVALEALACGTPVIATDVGGLPAALGPLAEDALVPPGDHVALAERLRRARAGDVAASPAKCRDRAEAFGWDAAARRHRDIYRAVVARPARRRPRVVYLDHCAELSGAELGLARLLRCLDGVDAHVILAEDGPLVGRLARAGISVEVLPMAEGARALRRDRVRPARLPLGAGVASARYVATLARRLWSLRPDLVHTNSLKAALYGAGAGRMAGTPVVWQIHDRLAADYLPAAAIRLMGAAARLPRAIIVNSEATRATLPRCACPVEVIPCPVDVPPAPAAVNGAGADRELHVGVVGRIAPWKGQHLFLDGFARAFADGEARAVLVGAPLFGETDYERELHAQVARLGLDGRVSFRGFREDIAHELGRLDILVHSSVIPEPLGQVVLEGMAAGLPVVVPDVGGPAEIVRDEVTGLVYTAGDAAAMARALRRLDAEPALRGRLGARGREAAHAFSPESIAPRVEDLYRRVLLAEQAGRRVP